MPFLLIVSGLPATGKTTLSARLGQDLGLPVVHRDRLRRYVFDGFEDVPRTQELVPRASDRLVLGMLTTILDAGGGVVLDGNFNTVRHMVPVREFVEARELDTAEVCLWGDTEELRRRFIARSDPALTADLRPYFEQVLHRRHETVLSPPAVVEHLDTTDLASIDAHYPELLERIRAASGRERPGRR